MNTKDTVHYHKPKTEVQLLELLHTHAMAKDETVSMSGRLLKETMPGLMRWINAEMGNNTDVIMIMASAADMLATTLCSVAVTLAGKGENAQFLAMLIERRFQQGVQLGIAEIGRKK